MKQRKLLPLAALVMGLACLVGRRVLYTSLDSTGLLKSGTPLEWGTYLLSVLALALWIAASRREEGKILPDSVADLGQLIGAVGVGWTALRYPGEMPGVLGNLWKILGVLTAGSLVWSAYCGRNGKTPHFLFSLFPCLFWLIHLVDNYRGWSGRPQLQSYLFDLLATIAMALLAYYRTAADVGLDKPRMRRFTALAAGFLCLSAVLTAKTRPQYLLCVLWALTSLYSPKPEKAE